jgi:inner membrane protein
VENLTHSLVGGLLAQTAFGRKLRYATPTLVIAANLPDADAITALWGGTTALKYHRGLTHSLIGIVAEAAILGALSFIIVRRSKDREHLSFVQILLPIFVALLSHPLLDWTNSYGIRPWLPWNGHWYYGDIVFIADPWLWLILGGGLFLVTSRNRLQVSGWACLAIILSLIVVVGIPSRQTSFTAYIKLAWVIGLALVVALRLAVGSTRLRSVPPIALAAMILYWSCLLLFHRQMIANITASPIGPTGPTRIYALATPANPFVWTCIADTGETVYQVDSSVFQNPDWGNSRRFPKEASDEMIEKMRSTETGKVFLDFARAYSSKVTHEPDGYSVTLRDLRFGLSMYARFNEKSEIVSSGLGEKPNS